MLPAGIQYDDEDEDEDDLRGLRGRRGADDDDDDDEDDDGVAPGRMTDKVDGEEDDGEEKVKRIWFKGPFCRNNCRILIYDLILLSSSMKWERSLSPLI